MPDDDENLIPLRWEHLTVGERYYVREMMPEAYQDWEIIHGFYTRIDGEISFIEDSREH